jgi:hypothetical protein
MEAAQIGSLALITLIFSTGLSRYLEDYMFKIFLILSAGLSCLLMMSCSTKISYNSSPEISELHIVDNRDGTFTDNLNHLQWTKDDSTPGPGSCYGGTEKNFWYTNIHVDCLNKNKYLGYSDWRMPTYEELEILRTTSEIKNNEYTLVGDKINTTDEALIEIYRRLRPGDIFNPIVNERLKNHAYWSTADLAIFIYKRGIMLYNVTGSIYVYNRGSGYYVWPVRSMTNTMELVASSVRN